MPRLLLAAGVGLVAGLLSGAFGIGGGIVTTPAIRLLLGAPALVAVGTPLPAILPSAVAGAYQYVRSGVADVRTGVTAGLAGALTAVLGAWLTRFVGGTVVLLATSTLILVTAVDMVVQAVRPPRVELEAGEERDGLGRPPDPSQQRPAAPPLGKILVIGAVTGLYSGFLGLGGGFVLVPLLVRWTRFPLKAAIGTSLVAIGILSVPGTITHWLLGNVDWAIALGLTIGVIPGALIGARITLGSSERATRIGFAVLLGVVGVWLAISEIVGIGR